MRQLMRHVCHIPFIKPRCFGRDGRLRHAAVLPILILTTLLAAGPARSETVVLSPAKDNTLYESPAGLLSNGQGDYIFAGRTNQPVGFSVRRSLLYFDVAAGLPADAIIQEARLTLHMSKTIDTGVFVGLHRALADWGEGTSHAPLEEGAGAPAEPGDATWLHRSFGSALWETRGGDFVAAPSASMVVVGIGFYTWPSTSSLVADVQAWVDNPQVEFGWFLVGMETVPHSVKRFDSRNHANPANRPTLEIVYTIPIPTVSAWGLVVLALLLLTAGTLAGYRPANEE